MVTIHTGTLDIFVEATENGIVKIKSDDYRPNAEDISVTLKVESAPRFGVIQVNKVLSNIFTLRSLIDGVVTYIHTTGR